MQDRLEQKGLSEQIEKASLKAEMEYKDASVKFSAEDVGFFDVLLLTVIMAGVAGIILSATELLKRKKNA